MRLHQWLRVRVQQGGGVWSLSALTEALLALTAPAGQVSKTVWLYQQPVPPVRLSRLAHAWDMLALSAPANPALEKQAPAGGLLALSAPAAPALAQQDPAKEMLALSAPASPALAI